MGFYPHLLIPGIYPFCPKKLYPVSNDSEAVQKSIYIKHRIWKFRQALRSKSSYSQAPYESSQTRLRPIFTTAAYSRLRKGGEIGGQRSIRRFRQAYFWFTFTIAGRITFPLKMYPSCITSTISLSSLSSRESVMTA